MIYFVETTLAIAQEMARYEGATILDRVTVREPPEWLKADDKVDFTISRFKISSDCPCPDRWRSFGVTPHVLE